jgi:hypothetical protein
MENNENRRMESNGQVLGMEMEKRGVEMGWLEQQETKKGCGLSE